MKYLENINGIILLEQFFMLKSFLIKIIVASLFFCFTLYANAQEKINLCDGSNIVVAYTNIENYHLVCDSVNNIIEVARKIGLSEELNITISIVDKLTMSNTGRLLAFFNPGTMEIQVLSMKACRETFGKEVLFGQEMDKELYRSLIIHEIAHALFWNNMGEKLIAREIHEYFAYTIQLALLDEAHRNKIIYSCNVPAYVNMSEISEEYYLLSPKHFAVKSYLHFINNKQGWPFLLNLFK